MDFPMLRIELEQMRHQVIHAISNHHTEIKEALDKQLSELVVTFPFYDVIRQAAYHEIGATIKKAMEDYFRYGEGAEIVGQMARKFFECLKDDSKKIDKGGN